MQTRAVELEARETDWEYAPGRSVAGMGFNGSVPGPLIEAEVGDTIRARLTNSLSQPTTIHWHGLRVPASMDGAESVQTAVEPGASFDYEFSVPDAGTFWYHTHVNETEQLERGFYGPLVVRGPGEPTLDAERVLMLDDLKLDADGRLSPFGDDHELHDGREGDIRLVNGLQEPDLQIARGPARALAGRERGEHALHAPLARRPAVLDPRQRRRPHRSSGRGDRGARHAGRAGRARGRSLRGGRGARSRGAALRPGARRAKSRAVRDDPRGVGGSLLGARTKVLREIAPLTGNGIEPTRTVSMKALMHGGHGQRDDDVRVGELQVWDLVNETSQDHPFHPHGFFFQVLSDGPPAWKDTVNVPQKAQVRIAWLPDDRPGEWMYHCHILEHHAMGMMAHFRVVA
jgi:FtsP/CotA-like multicopper oxidase with cupredoxin domain